MKMKDMLKAIALASALALVSVTPLCAQEAPQQEQNDQKKETAPQTTSAPDTDRLEPDDAHQPADIAAAMKANRREQASEEEAAIVPYYNNYLSSYRLGPEDVISIRVFGQDRYSLPNITVPPDGKISYYLVPEGILVNGKTTQQLSEELTKRLDEYIIDPQVTVSLEKAVSATYSVIGDVAQPGVRTMTRRYSVMEALAMAGGILNTGDKSKVFILRQQPDGRVQPIPVNIKEIERGRAKEMAFLVPGDQVVVPGNTFKRVKQWTDLLSIVSFARIFTGGF